MSALYGIFSGVALAQIFAADNFNKAIDYLSPVYFIVVLLLIISYHRRPIPRKVERVYTLAKKEMTWRQMFIGTWEKTERPGFKEFAMFMGQSSMIAGYAEGQPFGNTIAFQDASEKLIKIDATGIPAHPGQFLELGAAAAEAKDPKGNMVLDKVWWNEEEKKLYRTIMSPESESIAKAMEVTQIREITPDDKMVMAVTATRKKDGQSVSFKVVFKRA